MKTTASRRLLFSVYLPSLLLWIGQGILVPTLPLYAQSFGVSFGLVSLAVASLRLGTVAADLPIGMLLERLGRRPTMLIGTGAYTAASLATGLAGSFAELVVYQVIAGVAIAMWQISRMAYVTDAVPLTERAMAMATFAGLNRLGTFIGPAIGGLIAVWLGLAAPCLAAAALSAVALALAVLFTVESPPAEAPKKAHLRWRVVAGVFRNQPRNVITAGIAQLGVQMVRAGRQVLVPLYGTSVLGLDVAAVGGIVSFSWGVEVVLALPAGYVMDRFGRKYAWIPSFVLLAVGMALIPLAQDAWGLIGAVGVMGLGNGLGSGSMLTLGADLAPRGAVGEFIGIWRLVGDAGAAGGPLAVGGVADLFGLAPAALVLAGVGLLSAAALVLYVDETKQPARAIA